MRAFQIDPVVDVHQHFDFGDAAQLASRDGIAIFVAPRVVA